MPAIQKNEARLDLRMAAETRHKIEQAACVSGQSITEFAVSAMLSQAMEILEKHLNTWLTDRDRDLFLAMLDSEEEPNEALTKASERYQREHAGVQ